MAYRNSRTSRNRRFRLAVAILVFTAILVLALFALSRNKEEPAVGSLGLGVWIYDLNRAEGGDMAKIVAKARKYRLSHLVVCADRNGRPFNNREKIKKLFNLCCENGIIPVSFESCCGQNPLAELKAACQTVEDGAVFCIFDMEGEYESKDGAEKMEAVLLPFRNWRDQYYPDCLIGVSTFGLRSYHASFPWEVAFKYCDIILPQYYWSSWEVGKGWDMKKSLALIASDWGQKYAEREDAIPIIPTLQAYGQGSGFVPTKPKELEKMLKKIDSSIGINIFRWELMDQSQWEIVRKFTEPKPKKWSFWQWFTFRQPSRHSSRRLL